MSLNDEQRRDMVRKYIDYYAASNDGTVLVVSKTKDGIRLTYNTPYYKK